MSSPAMVPVFSPDGQLGDIPQEQVTAALSHGAKLGVRVKDPNGNFGYVPHDRVKDAFGAGATAAEPEAASHPGFWSTATQDVIDIGKNAIKPENVIGNVILPGAYSSAKKTADEALSVRQTGHTTEGLHAQEQKNAGYGLPYRILTPVAENLGVNVSGMEESAKAGDPGAIAAHGTVAAAPYVAGALLHTPTGVKVGRTAIEVGKGARRLADVALFDRISKGAEALNKTGEGIRPIWSSESPVFPGAPEPTALPEQLNPSLVSESRTLPGQHSPEIISPPQQVSGPIPPRSGLMLPGDVVDTSPKAVGNVINESLGGWEGPKPGVRIADQFNPNAVAVEPQGLPSGFKPVESSALKGYKYDPSTREFHSITSSGQEYIHGDVSPEQASAFESAPSKGKAWSELKNNSTYVGKIINGKRINAIPPAELRSATPEGNLNLTMDQALKADPFSKESIAAENDWYQQAKAELGDKAPISKIAQRAQQLKTQARQPEVISEDLTPALEESVRRAKLRKKK